MTTPTVFPWECRDKEDVAKALYDHPLRRNNQALSDENMKLKKILRENGIAWSPVAQTHLMQMDPTKRKTRSSMTSLDMGRPYLPMEVLLRVLKFAMQSPQPIIDPLSRRTPENMTEEEKSRGNQIAIHFLVTCRALHVDGTRYLWESNEFTFTTPQALRHFSELNAKFRHQITKINLRIVARYYDDQRRKHKLEKSYHPDLQKDQLLKVHLRPKESLLNRGGFRCYTWNQVVDFLAALRAPYDPSSRTRTGPRPRLIPSLNVLRIDLVNFSNMLLPFSGHELHEMASHELGCTLNELQITGMPDDDTGMKASAELCGMLKDEGLLLEACVAFLAKAKHLQTLPGHQWVGRVVRAYKGGLDEFPSDDEDEHMTEFGHNHVGLGVLPPAPAEEGHPESSHDEDRVLWKRIPSSRDSTRRHWVQFSRSDGFEISESEDGLCDCCGEYHDDFPEEFWNSDSLLGLDEDDLD